MITDCIYTTYKVILECHYKGCLNLIWPLCNVKIANVIIKWPKKLNHKSEICKSGSNDNSRFSLAYNEI